MAADNETPSRRHPSFARDDNVQWRAETRLAVAFLLDEIAILRRGRPVLDTLLTGAILQANIQHIISQPDLRLAFARDNDPPSDEVRRAVSMNALAASLNLPFETVRRRVRRLAAAGECKFVAGGVIVPVAALTTTQVQSSERMAYERLKVLHHQLRNQRLLGRLPSPSEPFAPGSLPVRAVTRQLGAYLLRVIETGGVADDLIDGLACQEIFRSNVEAWPLDLDVGGGPMAALPPLKPISITALARRIDLPHETVRRRVSALVEAGCCVKVRGGVVVSIDATGRRPLATMLRAASDNLPSLFAVLAQLGVLQMWDEHV